jgi:hypothetical protein
MWLSAKGQERMVVDMWYCFTVVDTYTGLDRGFRWREAVCGYCGVDYRFELYDGMCGRWVLVGDFVDLNDGFEYCRDFDFEEFYRTYGERWV